MKSIEQINAAREAVVKNLTKPGLHELQSTVLYGMLNALAWVCDSPTGSTLQRLIDGEPLATNHFNPEAPR